MKRLIAVLVLVAALTPATSQARRYSYSRSYSSDSGYYTARSGHRVHRPVQASSAPVGASAQCRDGSWSFSESRRGTCSRHGGVSRWL